MLKSIHHKICQFILSFRISFWTHYFNVFQRMAQRQLQDSRLTIDVSFDRTQQWWRPLPWRHLHRVLRRTLDQGTTSQWRTHRGHVRRDQIPLLRRSLCLWLQQLSPDLWTYQQWHLRGLPGGSQFQNQQTLQRGSSEESRQICKV